MMAASSSSPPKLDANFDPEELLKQLELPEKIALVSGVDFWHTASVKRLGIPSLRLTDGPNGVRGTKFFNGTRAGCLPCGTALGATWNTHLLREAGALLGRETIAKGACCLLGPTVNMQRSPLGGRGFESYSEDPVLAGNLAAACVNGIQSTGVAAALKHFVCNDLEDKRMSSDSILSERALRELYLMPFMIAQRDAKPWSYMTSYNRVNSVHASENPKLLKDILRKEWGFDGLVMSDWFGTYSTTEALQAGLDLEMPGPTSIRGKLIGQAMACGKLQMHELDARVLEVLKLVRKVLSLGLEEGCEEKEANCPETSALLRKVAGEAIVLMKNEGDILPFSKSKTTAVIGPNASIATYCGGGSAALWPYYAISPLEGVKEQVMDIQFELGAPGWKRLPLLSEAAKTQDGKKGLNMKVYTKPLAEKSEPIDDVHVDISTVILVDYKNPALESDLFWCDFNGYVTVEETAEYEFSCAVAGTSKIFVDDKVVVDNETEQTPGDSFFGSGTIEEKGSVHLEAEKKYHVYVTFGSLPTAKARRTGVTPFGAGGIRLGFYRKLDLDVEIERAVSLAKSVDQVILCAGLNSEWEAEGYDREHMDLPPGTDTLIEKVVAANPNTVVIMQSGTPVTMPWLKQIPALLHAWYGGNETGNAIADAVFGDVNPSGKLPLSFPLRNEDNPAFLNYNSDSNRTVYGEDVYMGYRFYEKTKKDVAFPFGHGLSYTKFEFSDLGVTRREEELAISVNVRNTGDRDGSEVVQVYISQDKPSINRPVKELKGFAKVQVPADATAKAEITISLKYATSFWDELRDSWASEKGAYTVHAGNSSASLLAQASFEVEDTSYWRGL